MKGLHAEVGGYTPEVHSFRFYGGGGPYYFAGNGKNAYGGQVRFNASYKTYVSVDLSTSYDNVFHGRFQAALTLSAPFGPRQCLKSCRPADILNDRLVQPVVREEIVVVDHREKNFTAIDPATGAPYYFIFVDNTSHSDGTYESPYPALDQALANSAEGDILYLFPGDGMTTGLTTDSGFQLLNRQSILGSGLAYTFPTTVGDVSVPVLANGLPHLFGTDPTDFVIGLANQNTIAGLHLETDSVASSCIDATSSIVDCTVIDNFIEPTGSNEFALSIGEGTGTFFIQGNTVNGADNSNGISISVGGDAMIAFLNNSMNNGGVEIDNDGMGTSLSVLFENNSVTGGLFVGNNDDATGIYQITSNQFSDPSNYATVDASMGTVCVRFQDNTGTGGGAYSMTQADPAVFNLEPFTGNTPDTYAPSGTINSVPQDSCD